MKKLLSCLLFALPLMATPSQDAMAIYEQGAHLLASKDISSDEYEYLKAFPFDQYSLLEVVGQGFFYVDAIEDCIKDVLKRNIPWERDSIPIMERYVTPGSIALDIGSHIGTHTVTMSRCVGSTGKVLAFEPQKKIFRELCMNLAANQCHNVSPMKCAIGNTRKNVTIVLPVEDNEGAAYVIDQGNGEVIPMTTIDHFKLTNVSFIKIDTENTEKDVLEGAWETIVTNRPVLLLELQGNCVRAATLNENMEENKQATLNKLYNLGYRVEDLGYDYLALPKERY